MDTSKSPKHIAIIMDGNGRWAKERNMPRAMGHKQGLETVRQVIRACPDLGVGHLTLYAFSNENWKRPAKEVDFLMNLLNVFLEAELAELKKEGVCFKAIGRIDSLPTSVQKKIDYAQKQTSQNSRLKLQVALNYGSRQEMVDACKAVAFKCLEGSDPAEAIKKITESDIEQNLYTAGMPDPDLLIRTSGEMRISNFLLWQISYSEFHISPKYWPEFTRDDFCEAIESYNKRKRRFGAIS